MSRYRWFKLGGAVVAVSAVLAALTATVGARRPPQFSPETAHAIDSIVAAAHGSSQAPGILVGIWDPARGSYVKKFGTGDVNSHRPLAIRDHVRIASISKTFTAMIILQLVDHGRLHLQSHLADYVPGIENGEIITVEQLLNMTAGVFNYTEDKQFLHDYFADPAMPFGTADILSLIRSHLPAFAPGTNIQYSDSNYVLLQLIVESVTGQSLGASIDQNISQPLGLHNTTFPTDTAMPLPFMRGYLAQPLGPARDVTVSNPGVAGGAGAMISNLGDLKRWSKALATGELISPHLHQRQLQFKPLVKGKIPVGYGLGVSNLNGFIGHNGGILGYSTAMFYLPSRDATIVVEANQDNVGAVVATALFVALASYLYPEQFPNGI